MKKKIWFLVPILITMTLTHALNPLKIFVRKAQNVHGNYIVTDSLVVKHAYVETLDAHSPIHVVAPLRLYYDTEDSGAYVSWFVRRYTDTFATVWGDTISANTTDTVCIGDSISGDIYIYDIRCDAGKDGSYTRYPSSNFTNIDTLDIQGQITIFSCIQCTSSVTGPTSYTDIHGNIVYATAGETVFVYNNDLTDSAVIVGVAGSKNATWWLLGCYKHWFKIGSPCIEWVDTLYQIFGNDTFYLRSKGNINQ